MLILILSRTLNQQTKMKNKFDIKIMFKRLSHAFRNIGSDADKDWRIIITIFALLFVASVVFHVHMFLTISNQSGVPTSMGENSVLLSTDELSSMVELYERRAEEYQKIKETTFTLIDPAR